MSRLRIAYLCLQATTEGQASHAHVQEIIKGLTDLGHSVDLYEPRYSGHDAPQAIARFFEFIRIQSRLIRHLREYDVLYVRGHPLALPAAQSAKRHGVTTIQECNGPYEDFVQAWPASRMFAGLLAAMARTQFRSADAVTAVTPQLAAWLSHDTGTVVEVVPNGANVDLFAPGQPRPQGVPERYAVFFGALQPWQGVDAILAAALEPNWPLGLPIVVAGEGLLADDVRAAAEQHPDRIIYIGRLPYHSVPALVSNASVSLIGFNTAPRTGGAGSPVKLYESMASEVPIVAGDLPGQAEVIRESDCGILVDPITPLNLASAVAHVIGHPEMAREMGKRARAAAVEHHSWAARSACVDGVIQAAFVRRHQSGPGAFLRGERTPRIAYVSLQAVVDGQDTWAAVTEIIKGIRADGWIVDEFFPRYKHDIPPGPVGRLVEMCRIQLRLSGLLGRYDAIYVRAHPAAWPIARLAHHRRITVVQECNGPYEDLFIAWPSTRLGRPFFEGMQRGQYKNATAIVSVAQGLTDWLRVETGNQSIVTNGNGANIVAFRPDVPRHPGLPERFAVFFGQFAAWQGISTLLEAARSPKWPADLRLVFAGDGVMRPEIEKAVAAMPERVVYVGKLPYEEVAEVVAHAVLAYVPIVTPEHEVRHSPLKLYEAMACGVPVVASDTIGISEVVQQDHCGTLVTPGDVDEIVEATLELYADPAAAAKMGARGRTAAVEKYSWGVRARQRRAIVEDAISRSSADRVLT